MVRVKICGITNAEDAHQAVQAGADALGFMFFSKSPRYIDPGQATSIVKGLPPYVSAVGVFVDETPERILQIARDCRLDTLQFHGNETPEMVQAMSQHYRTCRAFRVRGPEILAELRTFPASSWLLDAYVEGRLGGTGAVFDWGLAAQAVTMGRPLILAGGLHCGNIADAIRSVRPYAVDVSSGVEFSKGKKNPDLVAQFIKIAKSV